VGFGINLTPPAQWRRQEGLAGAMAPMLKRFALITVAISLFSTVTPVSGPLYLMNCQILAPSLHERASSRYISIGSPGRDSDRHATTSKQFVASHDETSSWFAQAITTAMVAADDARRAPVPPPQPFLRTLGAGLKETLFPLRLPVPRVAAVLLARRAAVRPRRRRQPRRAAGHQLREARRARPRHWTL
jgi:hypothetical protein